MVDEQRPQDRPGTAGHGDQQGERREWGRSSRGDQPPCRGHGRPRPGPGRRRPWRPDRPGRRRRHRAGPGGWRRRPAWSTWSIRRGSRPRGAGAAARSRCETCSVSGITSPMANEPVRLTSRVTQGKAPGGERVVRLQEIAGDGAERPADEDGHQRRRGQPQERKHGFVEEIVLLSLEQRTFVCKHVTLVRRVRARSGCCAVAVRPWPGPPVPPQEPSAMSCRRFGALPPGGTHRRTSCYSARAYSRRDGATDPAARISRGAVPGRGGTGRARSPARRRRTSTGPWRRSPGCAGTLRRRRPRR